MRFIVITGLSGSGKSTAAQVLEDEGYYVIDNFPLSLLPQFLAQKDFKTHSGQGIALVVDARNPDFILTDLSVFDVVIKSGHQLEIYYFDATDDALIRRYSTTRRRHPLTSYSTIASAIASERVMLHHLRDVATVVFDTTELSVHQLKASVLLQLNGSSENSVPLTVRLQSFGFRYGVPLESDVVIDVRFLPNPHYIEALRPLSGQDKPVSDYVLSQPICQQFLDKTASWLEFLLPQYRLEGKSYLTVSIGCTGGHHRSVAIVEALYAMFIKTHTVKRFHRDLVKEEG